jgi:sugar/nucleoside kinase (ribokinase family)
MSAAAASGPQIVVLGGFFLELVFGHVEGLPGPGEEIFTDEFALSCGGGVTVADAAARGGARAALVACLGRDLGTEVLERHCARAGIDLGYCERVDRPVAGITVVVNFAGERAFISHLPDGFAGRREQEAEHWRAVLEASRPDWLEIHAGVGVAPVLEHAKSLGVRVALDASVNAMERDLDSVRRCVELADLFVPNETELMRLTGAPSLELAASVATGWCEQLVVKRGPAGALLATPGRRELIADGLEDVEVLDRTGAGDAFIGAMLAALVGGEELEKAVVAGNAAGSAAVARYGGVGAVEMEGWRP